MLTEYIAAKKVLILGFGREGQATLKFLLSKWPEIDVAVADQREFDDLSVDEQNWLSNLKPEQLHFGAEYLDAINDFELIIKSPGINPRKPEIKDAVRAGSHVTSSTNLFFSYKKGKVIAVTGSKGKSTTASLIFEVLKAGGEDVELIGNIGRASLDFLATDSGEKVYVFEMSSYQLEDFEGGADVAVFVSFFPDHLDYHGDLDTYFAAKIKLAAQPKSGMKIIYNWHSERLREFFQDYQKAFADDVVVIPFNDSMNSKLEEVNSDVCAILDDKVVACSGKVELKGRHNLENMLAVAAVAKLFNIDNEVLSKTMEDFPPLEHRLEFVGNFKDLLFYNDAISTTPESTIAALEALNQDYKISTLIAGGLDRDYRFDQLAQIILESNVENLILFPETGARIEKAVEAAIQGTSQKMPTIIHCSDMKTVVQKAYQVTSANSICLLSCASPSYNLFKNFEERGRTFKEAIQKLATK
jgi:UDP-N-acetylmuramoylalanine--D-glutamate ligase